MKFRALGDTGIQVSEIGLGCWALGANAQSELEDTQAIVTIRRALELGVNLLDTADAYGTGHSEELVGRAHAGRTGKVLIVTKVGDWGREQGHPLPFTCKEHVILCCDASLYRLKTDVIDIYLCSNPTHENADVFMEAFAELQERGKIWYWGVSTNDIEMVKVFNRHDKCSVVELEYNVLRRDAETDILPYCKEHNLGAIVNSPMAMGKLTGKFTPETTFPEGDMRRNWLQSDPERFYADIDRARGLGAVTGSGRTMAQAALGFVLAHPDVSCTIPGAKRVEQVEANVAAADLPLTPKEVEQTQEIFER